MYPYYGYQTQRYSPDFMVAVLGLILSAGIAAVAIYNANNNKEALDIARKQYGADSTP